MKKHVFTATALAAILSMAVATAAKADDAAAKQEKCFGVAKAGKNDCKTAAHACAGHSTADGGAEFVLVPAGLCDKLTNGSTTEPAAAPAEGEGK